MVIARPKTTTWMNPHNVWRYRQQDQVGIRHKITAPTSQQHRHTARISSKVKVSSTRHHRQASPQPQPVEDRPRREPSSSPTFEGEISPRRGQTKEEEGFLPWKR
ncbi:hypothetical protein B0T18DRAFT_178783 [Schizothecium vesticola]|uniref:Uncharacterized protein n=1 Tax=Schizothecium vesticola TaxID=314040 RepID=A0AA40EPN4_9PEZI|nr:hypothetical protein B0T18DRAFT_178783 [Schizothecium vesticola]